jgi:hypothetical protein
MPDFVSMTGNLSMAVEKYPKVINSLDKAFSFPYGALSLFLYGIEKAERQDSGLAPHFNALDGITAS